MAYGETKVYFDGSHYIAIPHTTRPSKKRPKPVEELVTVIDDNDEPQMESTPSIIDDVPFPVGEEFEVEEKDGIFENKQNETIEKKPKTERQMTRKEIFEEVYKETQGLRKNQRRTVIFDKMRQYFDTDEKTNNFVNINLERKQRNLISRRIRMTRKANLQEFNYFVTFTYDGAKHTEDSFKKKLKKALAHLTARKGWKYMGVWERSPKKQRLHFHGIFYIPDGTIPGILCTRKDYNFNKKQMVETFSSSYFEERFGRNDFDIIDDNTVKGFALSYIMKYIEKSGEKIVYSKGLPQFFISDIMDEDIVCFFGVEDKKLLLFDDFGCWDEGCYMGQVSPTVISQLRKAN